MFNPDKELAREFSAECRPCLESMETDLLAIEKSERAANEQLAYHAIRAVHSVVRGAEFLGLAKISGLAQRTEDLLAVVGSGKLVPTRERVSLLLRATDRLRDLIQNPLASDQADVAEIMGALAQLDVSSQFPEAGKSVSTIGPVRAEDWHLLALLVDDDFASRLLLQTFLSAYGECHIAVNGREAVTAFRSAWEQGRPYDLICMDIMMPEMNGREAVRQIRAIEESHGVFLPSGATIIMTTAATDIKEVMQCFEELCDSYLTKPIDLAELLHQLKSYQLVQ